MRRVHLRGHPNILKRLLVHVAGCNLGLLLRHLIGVGTPRSLQGRAVARFRALIRRWRDLWGLPGRFWTPFLPTSPRTDGLVTAPSDLPPIQMKRGDFHLGLLLPGQGSEIPPTAERTRCRKCSCWTMSLRCCAARRRRSRGGCGRMSFRYRRCQRSTSGRGGARQPSCRGSPSEDPDGHARANGRRERPASVAETDCHHGTSPFAPNVIAPVPALLAPTLRRLPPPRESKTAPVRPPARRLAGAD